MYLLLSSAKKNLGDYLIYERGKALIRKFKPDAKIIEGKSHIPFKKQKFYSQLDEIKAIIIPGGPGLRIEMYPNIYPLDEQVFKLQIPVYFLGIGSKFYPGERYMFNEIEFSPQTYIFLDYLKENDIKIGLRDKISQELLLSKGYSNYSINGCPAWYDLDFLESPKHFQISQIRRILFTVPAQSFFFQQAKKILLLLQKSYPNVQITVSFHHGFRMEQKDRINKVLKRFHKYILSEKLAIIDASNDLDKINQYDQYDLHIGYRVHAHIFFLSHFKPSFLICEDSRAIGVLETLGGAGLAGWNTNIKYFYQNKIIRLVFEKYFQIFRPTRSIFTHKKVPWKIIKIMNNEISTNFKGFVDIESTIRLNLKKMKKFIQEIT